MVVDVAHPNGTMTKMPGNPIKLSDTDEDSYTSPPLLGQHTDEVLGNLVGLDAETLTKLRSDKIIG